MGDFSVNDAPRRDPAKRRISRAVKIGVLFALGLTCFTLCIAATVGIMALAYDFAGLTKAIGIVIGVIVFLLVAVAISVLAQVPSLEFIVFALWWLNNFSLE
jgi:hypothetical protein